MTKTYLVTDIDIFGNTITTQTMADHGVNAHSIRVAFHSSDLTNQFSSTTDAPAPTLTTSLSTPTADFESSTESESLPASAFVGIGVGSTIGVILLLSTLAWLARGRYMKRKEQFPAPQDASELSKPDKPRVPEIDSIIRPTELNGAPGLYELDTGAPNIASVTGRRAI